DLSLALCRESQQVLRPDLRLLVMSATLDTAQLAALLQAPVVESSGRTFPVEIIHAGDVPREEIIEACVRTAVRASKETTGDVLVVLPGEAEIRACEEALQQRGLKISIHPLYGQLSLAEQRAAIQPDRNGRRKIVLATSIAETSLTIEGISVVVDSG